MADSMGQISNLNGYHEEKEEGKAMSDIMMQWQAVVWTKNIR
jgi:hypothetical protein